LPFCGALAGLIANTACHEPSTKGAGGGAGALAGATSLGAAAGAGGAAGATDLGGVGGNAGTAVDLGGAGGNAGTAVDLTGRWALLGFEDPVGVELHQTNDAVIAGDGCCAGFSSALLSCCGPVTGQCLGRHASFRLSCEFGAPYDYAFDTFVSADGKRMAGTIDRNDLPIAWLRLGPSDPLPLPADPAVKSVFDGASRGSYTLLLTDAVLPGPDFSPQHPYRFFLARDLGGDLGAFGASEASWNAATQTLTFGPVPETAPALPVALAVRFEGTVVTTVDATMASGATYHFQATVNR